jgi:hypothetical protein
VIAIQLCDPHEQVVPDAGLLVLLDPETGERVVVDSSDPAVRALLVSRAGADAREICRRTRVDALTLSTAESYERPLAAFFKARERRR